MGDAPPAELLNTVRATVLGAMRKASQDDRRILRESLALAEKVISGWFEPTTCSYPDCNNESIKNSHSIQAAALKRSLGDPLYSPTWDTRASRLKVSAIAASRASLFPGYCTIHEDVFHFENAVRLELPKDDALQAMRTLHREYWLAKSRLSLAEAVGALVGKLLSLDQTNCILSSADRDYLSGALVTCNDFAPLQRSMLIRIKPSLNRLEEFVRSSSTASPPWLFVANIEKQHFSLMSTFVLEHQSAPLLSITLLPNDGASRLIVTPEVDFDYFLPAYVEQYLSVTNVEGTLRQILEDGTVDWYAESAWWTSLSATQRWRIESNL